ncbi:hypothetical protein VHEMI08797 [[Torrubiella] hemipterigena]|uniref:Calcineurin-like phosphoesterase domain-containing protein n=1 Tax=[Torrubiella] hemipterigena TaxID=1531966 RepID=A0A0A1TP80_9HYPO|nr:hypothetical protein VHEMI08797 [[Torrubiella] hemipterigena]
MANKSYHTTALDALDALLIRERLTTWQQLCCNPRRFVATWLYSLVSCQTVSKSKDGISVVCVSDTHGSKPSLPMGDILVHAGDLTKSGTVSELQEAADWIASQQHKIKIVVAGNHDIALDPSYKRTKGRHGPELATSAIQWGDIIYLENTSASIQCPNGRQLVVYGSPLSPIHGNWAFQYPRLQDPWTDIPPVCDILVTHAPPFGHGDLGYGCRHLLSRLWHIRPKLHVFGHVHEGAGSYALAYDAFQAAYEAVISHPSMWSLARLAWQFVTRVMWTSEEPQSQLVNAALTGGLRNKIVRQPIKVWI